MDSFPNQWLADELMIPEHLTTIADNYREAVCEISVALIHAKPEYQWITDNFELGISKMDIRYHNYMSTGT